MSPHWWAMWEIVEIFCLYFIFRSHGVMVSTLDFESSDPSSNLGGTFCRNSVVCSFCELTVANRRQKGIILSQFLSLYFFHLRLEFLVLIVVFVFLLVRPWLNFIEAFQFANRVLYIVWYELVCASFCQAQWCRAWWSFYILKNSFGTKTRMFSFADTYLPFLSRFLTKKWEV